MEQDVTTKYSRESDADLETRIRARNEQCKAMIRRTQIDLSYLHDSDGLLDEKMGFLAQHCPAVLDFGKSSRERFNLFTQGQITTCDINQFKDYPDVIDDLCNIQQFDANTFDAVICMAVLEHVYAPQQAVDNLHTLLKPGGYCLAYTPFLYQYHAPSSLQYQDYFRYTKDGLAYLFRNFSEVTLYPVRGRGATICNLLPGWKHKIEKLFGQCINKLIDAVFKEHDHAVQASGYNIWAKK